MAINWNLSGFSSGINTQLSQAPRTGIRNFHMFNPDTFTPGLDSKVYQMEMAAADRKLSHPKDKY